MKAKATESEFSQSSVPSILKWVLWLTAWGGLVFVTYTNNPGDLRSSLAFPIGLCGLLPRDLAMFCAGFGGWLVVIFGWFAYIRLSWAIKKAKDPGHFSLLYIVLCVLLVLNAAGCRALIDTVSKIH